MGDQRETIIPRYYPVAEYKKGLDISHKRSHKLSP